MTIVAKTTCILASMDDIIEARYRIMWVDFLEQLGGLYDDDPNNIQNGTVITRLWTDKRCAKEYVKWLSTSLAEINITPVSITLEDYVE